MPQPAKMILAWVLSGLVMLMAPGPAPGRSGPRLVYFDAREVERAAMRATSAPSGMKRG